MYVALPVFIDHVAGRPATASQIARTLEMPRNTAVRKLDWLTRQGYITRRGAKRRSEICPFWTISLDVAFVTNQLLSPITSTIAKLPPERIRLTINACP